MKNQFIRDWFVEIKKVSNQVSTPHAKQPHGRKSRKAEKKQTNSRWAIIVGPPSGPWVSNGTSSNTCTTLKQKLRGCTNRHST